MATVCNLVGYKDKMESGIGRYLRELQAKVLCMQDQGKLYGDYDEASSLLHMLA